MRIAEYKQIDTKIVEEEVLIPADYEQDENGETVMVTPEHTEIVRKEIPVMGVVYRDATPEEEAQADVEQAEIERQESMREPTSEERIAELEQQNAMLLECVLEMSEIIYA